MVSTTALVLLVTQLLKKSSEKSSPIQTCKAFRERDTDAIKKESSN